jgi:hypothetical protein
MILKAAPGQLSPLMAYLQSNIARKIGQQVDRREDRAFQTISETPVSRDHTESQESLQKDLQGICQRLQGSRSSPRNRRRTRRIPLSLLSTGPALSLATNSWGLAPKLRPTVRTNTHKRGSAAAKKDANAMNGQKNKPTLNHTTQKTKIKINCKVNENKQPRFMTSTK